MNLYEAVLSLADGSSFKVIHNIEDEGMFNAAVINWQVRTNEITAESLCEYINSKRLKGMTDHIAFTEEEFKQLENEANEHENL